MTTKEQSLERLIERVKVATGPDREFDCLVWQIAYPEKTVMFDPGKAFGPGEKRAATYGRLADFPVDGGWEDWEGLARHIGAEPITASIDAALALVERVLPGTYIEISGPRKYLNIPTPVPARWRAELIPGAMPGWADTAPLAILAALLSSLKETSNDHE